MSKIRVNSDLMYGDRNLNGSIVESRLSEFNEKHPLTGGDVPMDSVLLKPQGLDWGTIPSSDIKYMVVDSGIAPAEDKSEKFDFDKLKKEAIDIAKKVEVKTKNAISHATTGTIVGATAGMIVALSNKSGVLGFIGWTLIGGAVGNVAGGYVKNMQKEKASSATGVETPLFTYERVEKPRMVSSYNR